MNNLDIAQVVRSIRDLPPLPSVVLDLIHSFERQDIGVSTLAEKISRDQALAAKTLRLANSSFYGLASKVRTVKQAIVVLGFDSARALAVAGSVIDQFGAGKAGQIDVAQFWRHSIAAALCARSLALHAGLPRDDAFIAGLLHDVGRLVLASGFPERYAKVLDYCTHNDVSLDEAERCVLGVDHQRAGQMLAEAWKFPALIQRAIGQHHMPGSVDLPDLPGLVHVANAVVHALDLGGGEHAEVPRLVDGAFDSLGIPPQHLKDALRVTETQFEEACQLLMQAEV